MKTYFTLNNRRYEAKEFDFNTVCDLSELGIDFDKFTIDEFLDGINIELEHGKINPKTSHENPQMDITII